MKRSCDGCSAGPGVGQRACRRLVAGNFANRPRHPFANPDLQRSRQAHKVYRSYVYTFTEIGGQVTTSSTVLCDWMIGTPGRSAGLVLRRAGRFVIAHIPVFRQTVSPFA